MVLGIELRRLHILGKYPVIELHPQALNFFELNPREVPLCIVTIVFTGPVFVMALGLQPLVPSPSGKFRGKATEGAGIKRLISF